LEDLQQKEFFLIYHGKGAYTLEALWRMPTSEINAHVTRLYEQLQEEKRAHEQAMKKAKGRR